MEIKRVYAGHEPIIHVDRVDWQNFVILAYHPKSGNVMRLYTILDNPSEGGIVRKFVWVQMFSPYGTPNADHKVQYDTAKEAIESLIGNCLIYSLYVTSVDSMVDAVNKIRRMGVLHGRS